jgi:hypothetical protein
MKRSNMVRLEAGPSIGAISFFWLTVTQPTRVPVAGLGAESLGSRAGKHLRGDDDRSVGKRTVRGAQWGCEDEIVQSSKSLLQEPSRFLDESTIRSPFETARGWEVDAEIL